METTAQIINGISTTTGKGSMTPLRQLIYRWASAIAHRLEPKTPSNIKDRRRVCSSCRLQVRRHDRWHFGADGRPQHNDCAQPQGIPVTQETMDLLGGGE